MRSQVKTMLSEDNVLALLCVVPLFFFCLLFKGQCQKEHLKLRAIKGQCDWKLKSDN